MYISRVSLVSDNAGAFSSYSHVPFLNACNHVAEFPTIVPWDFTELDGIGYTNPGEIFKALTHDGGIRGTTVLLVKKLDAAITHHKTWSDYTHDKVFKKLVSTLGVRSCASIVCEQANVKLSHVSGLEPQAIVSTENWQKVYDPKQTPMGKVINRMS